MTLDQRTTLAGQLTSHASMWLLAASLAENNTDKRKFLANGFRAWSLAARHIGLLEGLAPNCAREGYDEAARVQDFVEARAG
jgi:hypothetical protein